MSIHHRALMGAVVAALLLVAAPVALEPSRPTSALLPAVYLPAVYVLTQADGGDAEQPWARLAAALELIRSSREALSEAETLRDLAARLAQVTADRAARKDRPDDAAREMADDQQRVAEAQLAVADQLLATARSVSDGARAAFESAKRDAFRPGGTGSEQPPGDSDDAAVAPPAADLRLTQARSTMRSHSW